MKVVDERGRPGRTPRGEAEREYNMALSRRIAKAAGGMPYAELASLMGVHVNTVAGWMRRDGTVPSVVNVAKLCTLLDVDANELLGVRRAEGREEARTTSD